MLFIYASKQSKRRSSICLSQNVQAVVDVQHFAGHAARPVGNQKQGRVADFFGGRVFSQRRNFPRFPVHIGEPGDASRGQGHGRPR